MFTTEQRPAQLIQYIHCHPPVKVGNKPRLSCLNLIFARVVTPIEWITCHPQGENTLPAYGSQGKKEKWLPSANSGRVPKRCQKDRSFKIGSMTFLQNQSESELRLHILV